MEVWDALRTRLTVRQFKPDPVPEELVTKLLQVGSVVAKLPQPATVALRRHSG